jgi:hypothetical protein
MKKLRLLLDDIRVDAFEVLPSAATPRGTVMGQIAPTNWGLECPTRGEEPTCNLGSCNTGQPCSYCP